MMRKNIQTLFAIVLLHNTLAKALDIENAHKLTNYPIDFIKETLANWQKVEKIEHEAWQYYAVIPELINKFSLKVGCEIGVSCGLHSDAILKNTNVAKLFSVDPYVPFDGHALLPSTPETDIWYLFVKDKLSVYGQRTELIRATSEQAAPLFQDHSLDFVFIDGDHNYEAVLTDLTIWYDKVRSGGLISGDDFDTMWPGVPLAVKEFFGKKNIKFNIHPVHTRVWWAIKP